MWPWKLTTAEVLPAKKTEAISSKYIVQYTFAAGTVASRVPIMEAIGVGWAFTISKFHSRACVHQWPFTVIVPVIAIACLVPG